MITPRTIWPNLFIVGVQKCGTTSMYRHLKQHPQVFFPEMKEPAVFANFPGPEEPVLIEPVRLTIEEYQRLYWKASGFEIIGDASPHYLGDREPAERIHEVSPTAKIIIMLRDPVVRAHSAYLMNSLHGWDSAPSFREALQQDEPRRKTSWYTSHRYVEAGLYCDQVRHYINLFGRAKVKVLLFEDLAKRPGKLLSSVASFLEIDPGPFDSIELTEVHNSYRKPRSVAAYQIFSGLRLNKGIPHSLRRRLKRSPLFFDTKKPPLDNQSRQLLQRIYDRDICSLEKLLGRDMSKLRKSWV